MLAQKRNSKVELTKSKAKELKPAQLEYLQSKLSDYTFHPSVNQNYAHVRAPPASNKEERAMDY